MMRRRQLIATFLLTLSFIAPGYATADAREDADRARRRFEDAECRVRDLANAIAQARLAVDAASARRASAGDAANSANQQIINSSAAINDLNARIAANTQTARQAAEAVAQRRADLQAIQQHLAAASQAVDKYRGDAVAIFESSPAFKLAAGELDEASKGYQSTYSASFDWLRSTDVYADLYDGVEEMETEVAAQRAQTPVDPTVLAAASNAWIDSLNVLNKFRDDYLSRDPQVIAAYQRLQTAQAARKSLNDRFNTDIANDNQLKQLMTAVADEQTNLATASNAINIADNARATAEQTIAQLHAAVANEQATLEAAQRDLA